MRSIAPLLAATLAASLLLPVVSALPFIDQVTNGGLESWDATNTVPDAWRVEVGQAARSGFATEGASAAQLRAKPNDLGSHLSIIAQDIPNNQLPGGTPRGPEDLPILPGQFYEFAFDAAGVYNGKGNGNATVTWIGALGNVLRVDTIVIPQSTGYASFEEHLQAPLDPLVPDAALSATIRFVVDGQSSDDKVNLWVDAVSFGLSTPVALPPVPAPPPLPTVPPIACPPEIPCPV